MLPALTSSQLIDQLNIALGELRRERPTAQPILATDADGTLWSGDVGEEIFHRALRLRVLKPAVAAPLREFARAHGVPEHDDPHEQAQALLHAHERGAVSERDAYMLMAWCFAGFRPDEMVAFAEGLIEERGPGCHHEEMLPVLDWARAEQIPIWVVSASPQLVVEQGALRLSIPRRNVLAMRTNLRDGYLAPGIDGPPTYAEGKAEALRLVIPDIAVLAAFGDNTFDVKMFHMTRQPVAVRPKPALLAHPELPATTVQLASPRSLTSSPAPRACFAPAPPDHSRCSVADLHAAPGSRGLRTPGTDLRPGAWPPPPAPPSSGRPRLRGVAARRERAGACLRDPSWLPSSRAYTSGALPRHP